MSTTVWDGVTIPTSDPSITTRTHAAAALPFTTAMNLAASGNVDLYAAILDMDGEILNLGRDRRSPHCSNDSP